MVYKCYIGHCEVIGKGEAYISSTIEFHLFKYFLEEESWLSKEGRQFLPTWLCSCWIIEYCGHCCVRSDGGFYCERELGEPLFFPAWKPHTSSWISWLERVEGVGPCWDCGSMGLSVCPPKSILYFNGPCGPNTASTPVKSPSGKFREWVRSWRVTNRDWSLCHMLAHTAIGVGGRQEREW